MSEFIGGDTAARVAHGDLNGPRSVEQCDNTDAPLPATCTVKRIHAVKDNVEQHLLKMHPVSAYGRQIAWHVHFQPHVLRHSFGPHEGPDIANEFAHVERFRIEGLPLEQSAHPVDDGAGTLVVLADVGNDRADFVKVR